VRPIQKETATEDEPYRIVNDDDGTSLQGSPLYTIAPCLELVKGSRL
jgi:hypothetical protein